MIDTSEQHPFPFKNLEGDSPKYIPWSVITKRANLKPYGDYSLAGYEREVAVERKSHSDLYGTLAQGREKFINELEHLDSLSMAAVIIESNWERLLGSPPENCKLVPKTIHRSIIAWIARYPRIHWFTCDTRRFAEVTCFQILRRYYLDTICLFCNERHPGGPENCKR